MFRSTKIQLNCHHCGPIHMPIGKVTAVLMQHDPGLSHLLYRCRLRHSNLKFTPPFEVLALQQQGAKSRILLATPEEVVFALKRSCGTDLNLDGHSESLIQEFSRRLQAEHNLTTNRLLGLASSGDEV